MSRSDRQGRRRRDACGGAALACLASALLYGCAPVAPMRGGPVAGAITVFGHPGGGASGRSGALDRLGPGGPDSAAWLVPGSTDPATRRIGTIALPASRESVVVLVYGDNRPGLRLMTTPWGLSAVWRSLPPNSLDRWLSILIHTPIALVQGVIPTLDGFQDAASVLASSNFGAAIVISDPSPRSTDSRRQELPHERLTWAYSAASAPARCRWRVIQNPLITARHHAGDGWEDKARSFVRGQSARPT